MFDLIIELNPNETEEEIDVYSLANITIHGEYGSLTSKKEKAPYQDMMIFISPIDLLDSIINLVKLKTKQYEFIGVDCSFSFLITNIKNIFVLTDSKKRVISKLTEEELVRSIWQGIDKFITEYRPHVAEEDGIIFDLDDSIKKFKTQFSKILDLSD